MNYRLYSSRYQQKRSPLASDRLSRERVSPARDRISSYRSLSSDRLSYLPSDHLSLPSTYTSSDSLSRPSYSSSVHIERPSYLSSEWRDRPTYASSSDRFARSVYSPSSLERTPYRSSAAHTSYSLPPREPERPRQREKQSPVSRRQFRNCLIVL